MKFSTSDKVEILLKAFDFNVAEINRKQAEQQKNFEWTTSSLLAAFAAVVALSEVNIPPTYSLFIKLLATTLIAVPSSVFIIRIPARRKDSIENAKAIESIEEALRLFEDKYYGIQSPFPKEWKGAFPNIIRKDSMPVYLSFIISIMAICVIAAIWLLL
jgi:hypothetical protein